VGVKKQGKLPRVRAYQREAYASDARFKLLICGRRWGKSKFALAAACDGHGPARGHLRGALQGARIGWIVPSLEHPSAAETWNDLKAALAPYAADGGTISEQWRRIELPTGGSVQVWSGFNPDTLRGPYFDGVIVDECSLQPEGVWAAVRPTLSDYGGWAVLCGTVPLDVSRHWFVALHRYAASDTGRARGWRTWRLPSTQNRQLTKADLAEARETLGERVFQREYGAELIGAEGGVWRAAWFEGRTYTALPPPERVEKIELALDAAWSTGVYSDYSSCQAWARVHNPDGGGASFYLLDELHGRWESPELRRRVAAFHAQWAATYPEDEISVVVEAAGGGLIAAQELREAYAFPVVTFDPGGESKIARNEAVSPLAEGGKVWLPSPARAPWIAAWIDELAGFPLLPHDDRCDAACIAVSRLRERHEHPFVAIPRQKADWELRPW